MADVDISDESREIVVDENVLPLASMAGAPVRTWTLL